MGETDKTESTGCWGFVTSIIAIIVLWALVFGVTIDGKHYSLSCDAKHGVVIER